MPRQPKCARCRHHGVIILKKGHGSCPFVTCGCWKCQLVTRRTRVTALHRNLSGGKPEQRPGTTAGSPPAVWTVETPNTPEQLSTSGGAPDLRGHAPVAPLDLRIRRPDPGEPASGLDREVLPGSSRVVDSRQMFSLPPPQVPFRIPDRFHPDFLLNVPGLPPVPGEVACRPLMFSDLQQRPVSYLLPSEDCRCVFFCIRPPPAESFPGGADVQAGSSASSGFRHSV